MQNDPKNSRANCAPDRVCHNKQQESAALNKTHSGNLTNHPPHHQPVQPEISVVVPIYNEQESLPELFERLHRVLDELRRPYQLIMVNDGSQDGSWQVMQQFYRRRPEQVVLVDFMRNFGQHMAVIAGFMQVTGRIVVTLDADLQNPPEEIPKLVELVEQGYDLVSGVRLHERQDSWFRKHASILINYIREKITDIKMTDHGCMLRAYTLDLVKMMVASSERSIFIPALAYSYARRPTEIKVTHCNRKNGDSRYSLYSLTRLNFDLMAGYSLVPIQIFSVLGCGISFMSVLLVAYLFIRRLWIGPEVEGVFTLFALVFFLIGVILLGIGIMGEYVGRIYKEVRGRQRFAVREVVGSSAADSDSLAINAGYGSNRQDWHGQSERRRRHAGRRGSVRANTRDAAQTMQQDRDLK